MANLYRVQVVDVTGTRHLSDPVTPENADDVRSLLGSIGTLDEFSLTHDGIRRHFNPAHIVSVALLPAPL